MAQKQGAITAKIDNVTHWGTAAESEAGTERAPAAGRGREETEYRKGQGVRDREGAAWHRCACLFSLTSPVKRYDSSAVLQAGYLGLFLLPVLLTSAPEQVV